MPSRTPAVVWDVLVAAWTLGWIGVAVWVGIDVHALVHLDATLASAGSGLQDVAAALRRVDGLPFLGSSLRRLANSAAATGASATTSAVQARGPIGQLAYLLGAVVALVPTVPLLAAYVPARLRRRRPPG
ncbi:MAG: hypothetical protein ACYDEN_12645 [Acidimicrobiales bacterium]